MSKIIENTAKNGKLGKITVIGAFIISIICFSGCLGPDFYTPDQQKALSLVSYLGSESLGDDSIDHYKSQKVHENGVAGLLYSYSCRDGDLTAKVKRGLEDVGFSTTEVEVESGPGWVYRWFSATNGNIRSYVTSYSDNSNNCVCISAGPTQNEEEVYKIYATSYEGEYHDYVRLKSDVKFSSDDSKTVERVAPLAGTIYAIKYPNSSKVGPQDAAVNVNARKSYDEMLAIKQNVETNESYRKEFFNATENETADTQSARHYPWVFFWVSHGGYYSPYRYGHYPGSGPVSVPRGTGYTIKGGGGPAGVK